MSTQKGNTQRTRPQKYKNTFAYKNTLHDTSQKTKTINNLQINYVCERCKKILEWKIKYKKYKSLKAAGKCNKCEQKTIKHSYHTICIPCAKERKVCPKCGETNESVVIEPNNEDSLQLDGEMQKMLKTLSERKRRTFIRYMNKEVSKGEKKGKKQTDKQTSEGNEDSEVNKSGDEESEKATHETLLNKLKTFMLDKDDDDDFDSEFSDSSSCEE